jgi:signal transduction histidine kinase
MAKLTDRKEKELYNAKINYFTNITHEIRTPLTLIKMPLDKLIAKGAYTPESEKDLRTIQANTDRLLSLTNQLLDMRKMERNELKISFIQENLCSIVRTAIGLFEQMAHDQRIKMNIDIPEHPVNIMCAKDSILTIISNLLSNAVKYGKETINIIVQCEDGETAVVRVESDGEVIPENEREKIFQIFYQRDGAAKEGQGTGLGLPYARNLANMHNGKLYLDGNVTEMNSCVLELPVNQKDEVKLAPSEPSISNAEKKVNDLKASALTPLIIQQMFIEKWDGKMPQYGEVPKLYKDMTK